MRFNQSPNLDPDVRWRIIGRSVAYTFGASLALLFISVPITVVGSVATCVALLAYFSQIFSDIDEPHTLKKAAFPSRHILAFSAYILLGGFLLAALLIPEKTVNAAVISWRIDAIQRRLDKDSTSKSKVSGLGHYIPASALARFTNTVEKAKANNLRISPALQEEIRSSLTAAAESGVPGYLPAAGAFINYSSVPFRDNLPDCLDTEPEHLTWEEITTGARGGHAPPDQFKFTACRLILDSPNFASRFQPNTETDAVSVVCQRCEVLYDGGDLPIARSKGFVNIIFTECQFNVRLENSSPEQARGLVLAILRAPDKDNVNYIVAGTDVWSQSR